MTAPNPTDPTLLAGLRKALRGSQPLQAKGAADGLFPAASKGKPFAELAMNEGWVEEVFEEQSVTTGGKKPQKKLKRVSVGWGLTNAGKRHLADVDDPKPLLEAILKAVQSLNGRSKPEPLPDPGAFAGVVEKATRECVAAVDKAFADLQQKLQTAFAGMQQAVLAAIPKPTGSSDSGPVLEMIAQTVKRIDAAKANGSAEATRPPSPTRETPEADTWKTTRTAFEELKRAAIRSGGLVKVPELTDAVRSSHPELTPARFHDLLLKWRGEDRLSLQVCSEKWLEPRGDEGIQSKHGLLFYVQMPQ